MAKEPREHRDIRIIDGSFNPPPDPLPQYAGLYAEWPELRPAGLFLYRHFDEWKADYRHDPIALEPALALCRSAAIAELLKVATRRDDPRDDVRIRPPHRDTGNVWSVESWAFTEDSWVVFSGATLDEAIIAALRAVRGEGK